MQKSYSGNTKQSSDGEQELGRGGDEVGHRDFDQMWQDGGRNGLGVRVEIGGGKSHEQLEA